MTHQIASQELTRPRPPDLALQVLLRNLHIALIDALHDILDGRHNLLNVVVDVLRSDHVAGIVYAQTVLHPLPQLDTRDLGGSSVFHEIVEWDATVSSYPGSSVGEAGGDVLLDALEGNLSRNFGAQEVGGSNLNFGTEVVVLKQPISTIHDVKAWKIDKPG